MHQVDELKALGIERFLDTYRDKDLLRLLTCGSVDDGKSTLIGRLLYDLGAVYEDQLAAVERDSARYGTTGESIDYALLVDGLEAEREQGITIDVAYRYFSTNQRKFIIADTPGHEQYTRNMATGASHVDLAVILIDARRGVLDQTRRHAFIATLLGIRHLVVAVNKMDLIDYSQERYELIRAEFEGFAARLQLADIRFVPLSALCGDNIVRTSDKMPWYQGGTLLHLLETTHIASDRNLIDLRLPVQLVLRPHLDFRGYAGTLTSGLIRTGAEVVALPSGQRSRVKALFSGGCEVDEAFAPMAVVAQLEDEIDISRGDMLIHPNNAPQLTNQFEAMLVWMNQQPLEPGAQYLLQHATAQTPVTVETLRYRMNVNSLHREQAGQLQINEIGRAALQCARPLAWDPYSRIPGTGSFILIDRISNATVAAGMIVDRPDAEQSLARRRRALDAGTNLQKRSTAKAVTSMQRAERLGQQPLTLWLTGLPRSGKSSLAHALEQALFEQGRQVHVLDGEALRLGLNSDLGFSPQDRWENQRRAAEVARLSGQLGLITLVAMVSPLDADRAQVRRIVSHEGQHFALVHCDAPLDVCEQRDQDQLYARARAGEISYVTGIDAPFDTPADADLVLDTATTDVASNVERILALLKERQWL